MDMPTEKRLFFHSGRRDLMAKTIMVLVQISIGTALASGFFLAKSPVILKAGGTFLLILIFGLGIWICPDRFEKGV